MRPSGPLENVFTYFTSMACFFKLARVLSVYVSLKHSCNVVYNTTLLPDPEVARLSNPNSGQRKRYAKLGGMSPHCFPRNSDAGNAKK